MCVPSTISYPSPCAANPSEHTLNPPPPIGQRPSHPNRPILLLLGQYPQQYLGNSLLAISCKSPRPYWPGQHPPKSPTPSRYLPTPTPMCAHVLVGKHDHKVSCLAWNLCATVIFLNNTNSFVAHHVLLQSRRRGRRRRRNLRSLRSAAIPARRQTRARTGARAPRPAISPACFARVPSSGRGNTARVSQVDAGGTRTTRWMQLKLTVDMRRAQGPTGSRESSVETIKECDL